MLEGNSSWPLNFVMLPVRKHAKTAPGLRKEGEKGSLYVKDIVK